MNENQIADIWLLIKEYTDKKAIEGLAERYVDLLADHGVSDRTLKDAIGHDDALDEAIEYYLGQDADDELDIDEDESNWDYDEEE
jgi:hypothetical protein